MGSEMKPKASNGARTIERRMRKGKLCLLAFAACQLLSCRQAQVQSRLTEYRRLLDPQISHATKADILRQLGMPEHCEPAGGHEFCRFRSDYGARSYAAATSSTTAQGASYSVFDQVDCEFDESGVFVSWRAYVQR